MQSLNVKFTFEDNDKFILVNDCSHYQESMSYQISLDSIFNQIQKKIPGTKGPIDSIKALLNNEKPLVRRW